MTKAGQKDLRPSIAPAWREIGPRSAADVSSWFAIRGRIAIRGATEYSTAHKVLKIYALLSVSAIVINDVPTFSALENDLQLSQNRGVPRLLNGRAFGC
jgi:hypothetical protein